jgi:NhaP-type Na+/H+ or K+/H+ antiporter
MIWAQGLLSFGVWVAYGYVRARGSDTLRRQLAQKPRRRRALLGGAYMLGSVTILFLGLMGIALAGGMPPGSMLPWGWVSMTILGLVFVHGQTQGAACLISLIQDPVTSAVLKPSTSAEQESPQS